MNIDIIEILIVLAGVAILVSIIALIVAIVLMVRFSKVAKNLEEITTILAKDVKEIDKGVRHVFGVINVLGGGIKKIASIFKKRRTINNIVKWYLVQKMRLEIMLSHICYL